MVESSQLEFTVGEWTVWPSLDRIERDGGRVSLEPMAMALLVYLAQHAGKLTTTDDLIAHVWRGQIIGDGAVYQSVSRLRKALGDDSHRPHYIETIPKKGYRLVARVRMRKPRSAEESIRLRWIAPAVALGLLVTLAAAAYLLQRETSQIDARSIAVLPFENLSPDPSDGYFVSGIHNDVLAQLAKIGSLKVISRTSVLEYQAEPRNMRQIGQELGVATILEGTVQRSDDAVHITVQLIDAETDQHLWAETYDGELTARNLFAIQGEIATSIAQSLRATLTPQEVARLSEVPTENTRAYQFYLSGNEYMRRYDNQTAYSLAAQQYERAVEQDPDFALAWAALSRAHSGIFFFLVDATEARRELARKAVEQAFQLAPDLPEAHFAMGYYYYHGSREYEAALREWILAEPGMRGDSQVYLARARIYRRMGELEQAVADMDRAIELDPRNIEQLGNQAAAYQQLGDYDRAQQYIERALEIAPDSRGANVNKALNALYRDGDITLAKAAAENPPTELGSYQQWLGWVAALYERDYDTALNYLDGWGNMEAVDFVHERPKAWYYGVTYQLADMPERALPQFQAARDEIERTLLDEPEDPWSMVALAEVSAYLGEDESAIDLAGRAVESLPTSKDALSGPDLHLDAILVFVVAGDHEAAIRELDVYLAGPGRWSIEGLSPDPRLDPIRDDPRFQVLVERYSRR